MISIRCLTAAALALLFVLTGDSAPAGDKPGSNAKFKELLQKRLATVTEIHRLTRDRFNDGAITLDQVCQAQAAEFRAKVDVCETKEDRMKAHQECIDAASALLKRAKMMHGVSRMHLLQVEAQLLEAQIDLERVKSAK